MALANKKNKTIFTKTGDGKDKVDDTKIAELETKFTNGEHIQDRGSFAQLGIVYLQLQNISEEIDELRRHLDCLVDHGAVRMLGNKNPDPVPTQQTQKTR